MVRRCASGSNASSATNRPNMSCGSKRCATSRASARARAAIGKMPRATSGTPGSELRPHPLQLALTVQQLMLERACDMGGDQRVKQVGQPDMGAAEQAMEGFAQARVEPHDE